MKKKRRQKGTGSLFLRGSIYWARWRSDGELFVRSTGKTVKTEAEKVLQDFVAPFRLGDEVRVLESIAARVEGVKAEVRKHEEAIPTLAVAAAWPAYVASQSRPDAGPDTMRMYGSQYGRFERWIKAETSVVECRHVTRQIASDFATYLGAELSPNSFNKYMVLLKRVWSVLSDDICAGENPWDKIRMKTANPHSRRELTLEELAEVAGSLEGELRTLFAIGIYTGLRLGDAVLLSWSNADLVRGMITVVPSKTKKNRKPVVIPIHQALATILSETAPRARRGRIMPELAELYQTDDTSLSDRVQSAFQNCGIETTSRATKDSRASVDVGFHSLRHTFVSLSANAGAPLAVVQAIVGHSNPAMTRHYYHESDDALRLAVGALPDVTGGVVALPDPEPTEVALVAALDAVGSLDDAGLAALARAVKAEQKRRTTLA